ncbi:MAG TPA: hypothetical protein VF181_04905 [Balneolaceae bacterium]
METGSQSNAIIAKSWAKRYLNDAFFERRTANDAPETKPSGTIRFPRGILKRNETGYSSQEKPKISDATEKSIKKNKPAIKYLLSQKLDIIYRY